ncbi:GAF domain-containing protein [Halosegnis sp.]|uniref:GAF domain-containing protein n=1 Tax=Halosegnis sp. TaxID=2864959 RepID=UPI0035D412B0
MSQPRVLCVDPDAEAREQTVAHLATALEGLGVVIDAAGTLADAERALAADRVDCVVTTHDLPDGTGLDFAAHLRTASPDAVCVLFTDADPAELPTDPVGEVVVEYVPTDVRGAHDRLAATVRAALVQHAGDSYPRPADEPERLAVLSEFDLEADGLRASLDRVADLAALHFDMAGASVNIIGDHDQSFLACQGMTTDWETGPRADSICTFTTVEDDPVTVIQDVQSDPRFVSVDRIAERGIRFYMGAPLVTAAGHAIGTLCVYDKTSRTVDREDRRFLRTLADLAMDILEEYRTPAAGGDP